VIVGGVVDDAIVAEAGPAAKESPSVRPPAAARVARYLLMRIGRTVPFVVEEDGDLQTGKAPLVCCCSEQPRRECGYRASSEALARFAG
jgi:hypothetical protein